MTLGVLVGRFAVFVSEQAPAAVTQAALEATLPEERFPIALGHIRDELNHHIVPLLLLARADGETAMAEREAVLRYCIARAQAGGLLLSLAEKAALSDYLRDFRPTLMQMPAALKRLEHETKDDIALLLAAAKTVVDADGERRPRELQFLEELNRDLAAL
jgi:tellurite resistance protein